MLFSFCRDLLLLRGIIFHETEKLGALFKREDAPGFESSIIGGAGQHDAAISTLKVHGCRTGFALARGQVLRTTCELREIRDNFINLFLRRQATLAGLFIDYNFSGALVFLL